MIRMLYCWGFSFLCFLLACSKPATNEGTVPDEMEMSPEAPLPPGWLVQPEEVIHGGPGVDGIRSIDYPRFIDADGVTFLADDELVMGVKIGDAAHAYPQRILDFHELVNDVVGGEVITVTFAPLTGSALAWSRRIGEEETTFGSSGLLYHNNLMPYDRRTGSLWSQMRLDCVNGEQVGKQLKTIPLVETTWKNWRKMFPKSQVLIVSNPEHFNYNGSRYRTYKTDPDYFLYPVGNYSKRLPSKERVLGVAVKGKAKALAFSFIARKPDQLWVFNEIINEEPVVFVGNAERNLLVAFSRRLSDGTVLTFQALPDGNATILKDEAGNHWNVFGEAVRGPRQGEQLRSVHAHVGYWFAWSLFYKDLYLF
ncbi:MAG: DUF3179 domain-containing protein [Saprospiraceae bacterium]